jgi:ribonuclease BN (tRNA processing enzyme)
MTSFRTFQTQIEEIQAREVAKQRVQHHTHVAEKLQKENKDPGSSVAKGKAKVDGAGTGIDPDPPDMVALRADIEDELQVSLAVSLVDTLESYSRKFHV